MAASTVAFGLMAVCIRLASSQLHPFEIAFFRNFFGLVFVLPLLFRHGPGILRTSKLPLYFMRCLIGIASMLAGFWAIVHLPLAQAVALSYSTPLFVTIGAVLVLGEVVRARRWSAVAFGFLGMLLIVRPGTDAFTAASLVAVGAAVASASVAISIKFLSRTEHPDAIVLYTTLLWVPMSLLPALAVWETPVGITWLWIALAGALGSTGHMFWTRALKLGDASLLTPISFLQIVVVALAGWALFGEVLDRWTLLGAAVIFGSNVYIARREAKLARQAVTDPEINPETPTPR
ncbi:DMT family transporter [Arenimonas fontis]|uniref:DMT family transporter n=2 Tax=Arenimonas fontis TaxID=2608255 RepID=A0A5B2ZFI4_9GAMM|nr:DMT family transporter [Arenimonas fontis]KAA2285852.1 DMT family transporter [Arenimonas fontis]